MDENVLGRRVATRRGDRGWTQADLAARAAISRVALSHIEAGMSIPGERTVVLLAGLLHMEPHELVEGTAYPMAKAERLPATAPRYTELEHQLAVLEASLCTEVRSTHQWNELLDALEARTFDAAERALITQARSSLRACG